MTKEMNRASPSDPNITSLRSDFTNPLSVLRMIGKEILLTLASLGVLESEATIDEIAAVNEGRLSPEVRMVLNDAKKAVKAVLELRNDINVKVLKKFKVHPRTSHRKCKPKFG